MTTTRAFTRRTILAGAAMQAAPAVPHEDEAAVERPNLLLLMTDQQSHEAWSGAGNPYLKTPAMDSLAARGQMFTNAYCAYPVCSPSRSSIFTSRMPHETGVEVNGRSIRTGMPTMGEVFTAAGYQTVYAGKWHLPKPFDGMTAFEKLVGGSTYGKDMDEPVAHACSQWLRRKPREPFLMVASFMNPHDICEWIRQHKGTRSHANPRRFPPAPANMGLDSNEPEAVRFHRTSGYDTMSQAVGIASEWWKTDVREYLHDYYRMVEAVDHHIGTILQALHDSGLAGKTVVCFTSDHGEGLGAHRWVQKASLYEESVHVPFVLAGPGVRRGVSGRLVSLLDILPTLCGYAGIGGPDGMRGLDLRKDDSRPYVVSELRYRDEQHDGRMVRSERYKYIVFRTGGRAEQLFDLEKDPGEVVNLAGESGAKQELERHREMLAEWSRKTEDGFARA